MDNTNNVEVKEEQKMDEVKVNSEQTVERSIYDRVSDLEISSQMHTNQIVTNYYNTECDIQVNLKKISTLESKLKDIEEDYDVLQRQCNTLQASIHLAVLVCIIIAATKFALGFFM